MLGDAENCPKCGVSLQGEPIPAEIAEHYSGTHWQRVIGIEYSLMDPDHYDGISEWRCPDCGYREGRWSGKELTEDESEPRFGGYNSLRYQAL